MLPPSAHRLGAPAPSFKGLIHNSDTISENTPAVYVVGFWSERWEKSVGNLAAFASLANCASTLGVPVFLINPGKKPTAGDFIYRHEIPLRCVVFSDPDSRVTRRWLRGVNKAPAGNPPRDWAMVVKNGIIHATAWMPWIDATQLKKIVANSFDLEARKQELLKWESDGVKSSSLLDRRREHLKKGEWDKAREVFEECLRLEAEPEWRVQEARIYFEVEIAAWQGRMDVVRDFFDKEAEVALRSGTQRGAFRLFSMGHLFLSHSHLAKAPLDFERPQRWARQALAISTPGDFWPALQSLTQYLNRENRCAEAAAEIESRLERIPEQHLPEALERIRECRKRAATGELAGCE